MTLFEPIIRYFWEGTWPARLVERRRRLYECELVYVSKGAFTLASNDVRYPVRAGAVLLVPAACWHESVVGGSRTMRHCIHFDFLPDRNDRRMPLQAYEEDLFDDRLAYLPPSELDFTQPIVCAARDVRPVLSLVTDMFERLRHEERTADLLLWPILRHLLGQQPQVTAAEAVYGKSMRAVRVAKHHLDLHYAEPITFDDLCDVTQLSKSHLCTIFRRIVGRPPMEYLAFLRLGHAQRLLLGSKLNVSEIARTVGMPDANYFARAYRRRYGHAPVEEIAHGLVLRKSRLKPKHGAKNRNTDPLHRTS